MGNIKQATKEQVRLYMKQRQTERKVPPPMEEIRRRVGWCFLGAQASQGERSLQGVALAA